MTATTATNAGAGVTAAKTKSDNSAVENVDSKGAATGDEEIASEGAPGRTNDAEWHT